MSNVIIIDCSDKKSVKKHIKEVFIHLQKAKTKTLLAAYYQWYKSNPDYSSEQLSEFEVEIRKNKKNISGKDKESATAVYGDQYAKILTKFVFENYIWEGSLIKIASELVELTKFEGRGNVESSKLFTKLELEMIKDIFKLLKATSGKIRVIETPNEEKLRLKNQGVPLEIAERKKFIQSTVIKNEQSNDVKRNAIKDYKPLKIKTSATENKTNESRKKSTDSSNLTINHYSIAEEKFSKAVNNEPLFFEDKKSITGNKDKCSEPNETVETTHAVPETSIDTLIDSFEEFSLKFKRYFSKRN
jgi:hypothetical protein